MFYLCFIITTLKCDDMMDPTEIQFKSTQFQPFSIYATRFYKG